MKPIENKLLATATPNPNYQYHANFVEVTMEARLIGNQIRFFELNNGLVYPLTHEAVSHMFREGHRIGDQPYLVRENRLFYDVLTHPQNYHTKKLQFIRTAS